MLYQHRQLNTLVTLLNERDGWVEFYDPEYADLRYLESTVFYQNYRPADLAGLRALARQHGILIPRELD